MKNKVLFILVFLTVLSIVSLLITYSNEKEQRVILNAFNKGVVKENFYKSYIFRESEIFSSNLFIDSSLVKQIFENQKSKHKLIFRYDIYMCESCILSEVEKLRIGVPGIKNDRICILAGTGHLREEEIKIRNELNGLNYLIVSFDRLKLCKDNINLAYYAVIDNTGAYVSVFVPDPNLPDLSDYYFEYISKKWFN